MVSLLGCDPHIPQLTVSSQYNRAVQSESEIKINNYSKLLPQWDWPPLPVSSPNLHFRDVILRRDYSLIIEHNFKVYCVMNKFGFFSVCIELCPHFSQKWRQIVPASPSIDIPQPKYEATERANFSSCKEKMPEIFSVASKEEQYLLLLINGGL